MIAAETRDGLALVTLRRADRGNALSAELVAGIHAAANHAFEDASVHTLVLRAEGRHFCTGFDLSDLDSCSDADLLLRFVQVEELLALLWHAPIRTVAIAQGRTWGAGADIFAACEERFACEDASFRFPGPGFGLVLGTRRLAERVGTELARRWTIGAAQVDASTALRTQLASAVFASGTEPLAGLHAAPAVSRETARALRAATRCDHRDADLAALVRSAATPGLRARIAAYRNALRDASGKAAQRS
jgi:enoyl-CoA hydratase/carnithine racemase